MNKAEELKPKTTIAFVTELMRAVKNTNLDDPIQFAAFRQVAEEKLDAFLNTHKSDLVKRKWRWSWLRKSSPETGQGKRG